MITLLNITYINSSTGNAAAVGTTSLEYEPEWPTAQHGNYLRGHIGRIMKTGVVVDKGYTSALCYVPCDSILQITISGYMPETFTHGPLNY